MKIYKEDKSPLTKANSIICMNLEQLYPNIPNAKSQTKNSTLYC